MTIFLDDRPFELSTTPAADGPNDSSGSAGPGGSAGSTLGDLVTAVKAQLASRNTLLVGIDCDGLDVTGEGFDLSLDKPLTDYARIDLRSADSGHLVRDALDHLRDALQDAPEQAAAIADQITAGQTQDALHRLGQCCGFWLDVQQGIQNALALQVEDLDQLEIDGQPLPKMVSRPLEVLREIKEAIIAKDFVLLADVLTYEMPEIYDIWLKIINTISPGPVESP